MSRAATGEIGEARAIPLAMIDRFRSNPRRAFGTDQLCQLAASIQAHGVLQPILVRPVRGRYEIVAGERRWRAAQEAGLHSIPATVREMDDRTAVELAVLENVQREALTPLEEADGFAAMRNHGWTASQIAERIGKSRGYVANRIAIADAGDAVRAAIEAGDIGPAAASVLARVPAEAREAALAQCGKGATSREAHAAANRAARPLDAAPFALGDPSLCPAAGTCHDCPKRSGADRSLFGDVGDFCFDGDCWRRKADVAFVQRAATHEGPILDAAQAAEHFDEYGGLSSHVYAERADEIEYCNDAKVRARVERLPVTLAQDPTTGAPVELVLRDVVDLIYRKEAEKKAKANGTEAAAGPERTAAQKAAEAERKQCEAASAALVAAAIADRKNAAARLVAMRPDYGDGPCATALAVAGVSKASSLAAWARKATKEDLAAFLLAERLENATCYLAPQVRALAQRLDLPVPEGFAEAPKPKAKAAKKGGAK